ncbi:MAG: hypothetical protein DI551_04320 [Micavibrio aeruginosavorus]|uniref:Uncharacterized protein n=1 Tax=Micavibrio aeruginosavorus TaxID=349221 RepID=A0A2W5N066_9BACT|nr:MAG: hypothetical protein DI551_04320 [Micavibrio aeruginosavorus]
MSAEFKTTLLREKFTLKDPSGDLSDTPPVVALSNRIVLPLTNPLNEPPETFVVRTQNMHSCTRLAGAIAKEYFERGAIMPRVMPFRWENLWRDVIKGYEKDWNPDIWCAIYHKGRVIFEEGARHPFLDIIEQCDAVNREDYGQSVSFAEKAFQQAGKAMKIDHDSNIALIVSVKDNEAKCGVILRGANRKTTFNYSVKPRKRGGDDVRIPTILTVSAAFLEGVQLAFSVGMTNRRRATGLLEKYSDEDRKGKRGAERLVNLSTAIEGLERKYVVQYRPDRPDFQQMVRDAEEFAMKILKPQIEDKIARGELNPRDWIH